MTKKPFVIMAKPAGNACNMRCGYCYYLHTGNEKTSSPVMTDEVLEAFIRNYIEASPGPTVSFTWHGGEPSLAGLAFYEKVTALQKRCLPEGWEVWNNLQTNGLLLDDAWCDFLKEHHFDVGISIDGTAFCHDFYRKTTTGENTYDKTAAAIRRLQERGIQPDLLCTVNAKTAQHGKEVYRSLRDLSTGWMQFIPIVVPLNVDKVTPGKTPSALPVFSPDSVTPEAYGSFLKDVFFEWFFHDMGRTEVQLFSETARALAGKTPTLCWMAPKCGNVLIVEKDGGIYSCDHFVEPAFRIGSVLTDDFQELLSAPFQASFGAAKQEALVDECVSCPFLGLCGGGCLKDRFVMMPAGGGKTTAGQYYLCNGLKTYFSYAVPRLKDAMTLSAKGMAPDAIMQELIQKERQLFKGVSRNDLCPCGSGLKFKFCCQKRVP